MRLENRAFTLVELLVSIGIVALLVGLLMPALGHARDRSRSLNSQTNLRSIGQIFALYIEASDEFYPAPVPGRVYDTPRPSVQVTMRHWDASDQWPSLFAQEYPWAKNEGTFLSPGAHRETDGLTGVLVVLPSYQYSASFLGQPKIWGEGDFPSTDWPKLERSVKNSMVRYPSAKALMWDVELPLLRRRLERDAHQNLLEKTPMLFADQHVDERVPAEANPGVTNWAPTAPHAHPFLHNTRDGVYGQDY